MNMHGPNFRWAVSHLYSTNILCETNFIILYDVCHCFRCSLIMSEERENDREKEEQAEKLGLEKKDSNQ